ncbi:MAG: hypothetical protein K2H23_02220, partial [Oscillospiraceae bacterium]|nr:hypothetical protein [Oscillospiraceae bacterium]
FIAVAVSVILAVCCFAGCSKDEGESADAAESAYNGILTKIKLGMPVSKILALQPDNVDVNYESDTVLWSVNSDIDLMEINDLIEDDAYNYMDNPIITYTFKTNKGDVEMTLKSYMSEIHGVLDREVAEKYFKDKTEELQKKHSAEPVESVTGTENVDYTVVHKQKFNCPSYDLTFTMELEYGTVNGVEGYHGSMFSIEVVEKEIKTEVTIESEDSK